MNYILFDGDSRNKLLPFTYTRPVADIRVGILTIREKWELLLEATTTTVTEDYLSGKWPMVEMETNVMINGAYFPSESLLQQIKNLKSNQVIVHQDTYIAFITAEGEEVDLENFEKSMITTKLLIDRSKI